MDGQALLHVNTKEKDEQLCRSLQELQTRKSWVTAPAQLLPRRAGSGHVIGGDSAYGDCYKNHTKCVY